MTIPFLQPVIGSDMTAVDRVLRDALKSDVVLIRQIAEYIVGGGGKRLRPALLLLTAGATGYRGTEHHTLAAVIEMIHTATLLHDDVVDDSDLRRGHATANAQFGNPASVLVGDFLYSRAFQMMVGLKRVRVLEILADTTNAIAEGEVLQLVTQRDISTPEATYLEVIKGKTAKLFAAAAEIGAMVAGRNGPERVALESFGMNLGIAFQLVDDALDYAGREAKLGKTVGDDFREGKITLPVILAFLRGGAVDREFWKRTIEKLDQRDGDLVQAQALIERHNALADTLERARHYGAMARDALGLFRDSPLKSALLEAVDFAIDRAH